MKIAVFGNNYQATHLNELRGFLSLLKIECHEVRVEEDFARYLIANGIPVKENEIAKKIDSDTTLVASIGGDGTFLHAADWVGNAEIPIMGINTGHLGYLTGYSFSNLENISTALRGKFDVSSRMTLELTSPYLPSDISPYALNEIAISKGDTTSMVEIKAAINGKYLADYMADGLVISTPTGSTAYNLSCGGPILEPTLDSIVLSPIAPHSLTFRPLVIDGKSMLEFEVRSRGAECHVGVDGRTFAVPADGSVLKISKASRRVNVVQPPGVDFASVLRSKLLWGG